MLELAMLFQGYQEIIWILFKLNCKVVWPASLLPWYLSFLLKSSCISSCMLFPLFPLCENVCMYSQASSFEEEEEEEQNPLPSHASDFSSSFMETYPHFLAWQYDVINPDGSYSSMTLGKLKHIPNIP